MEVNDTGQELSSISSCRPPAAPKAAMTHPTRLTCSLGTLSAAAASSPPRIVTPMAAPGGRHFDPPSPTAKTTAATTTTSWRNSSSYQMHPAAASAASTKHQKMHQQNKSPARNQYHTQPTDSSSSSSNGAYYFDKDDNEDRPNEERAFVFTAAGAPHGNDSRRAAPAAAAASAPPRMSPPPSRNAARTPRTSAAVTATPPLTGRGVAAFTVGSATRAGSAADDHASLTTKEESTQSLSAGSTASVDSFVQLLRCGEVEEWEPRDASYSTSSTSFSLDPYLSRRRKPSWARPPSEDPTGENNEAEAATAAKPAPTTSTSVDVRKLYLRQQQQQQRGRRNFTKEEADAFARQQRDIELQLQALSVNDDPPWAHEVHVEDDDTRGHESSSSNDDDDDDEFPDHDHLQSSFFTAESLRRVRHHEGDDGSASGDMDIDDDATDALGFPRHLTGIPSPTVAKIRRRADALAAAVNRRQSLLDVTSTSVASFGDDDDDPHNNNNHSKSNASSYSSAKTADAGVHSLPSTSKAADSERDRQAIQTVLHWRHVVSLRSQNAPRWITASTLGAAGPNAAAAAAASRRTNLPSLALAKAHLQLGNALLAIHEYAEACKAFQAAYKIFSVQPNAASRHILGMALCMERMGVATALAADPVAVVPASSSPPRQRRRSINEEVQHDPTFAMLVRSYTVQLESFRLRSLHLGSHHVDVISGLNHIAKLHCHNRDWVLALQCLWQVYWARTSVFGPVHPSCGVTAHDVANVFCHLRMHDDAANFYSIASHVYDTLNLPDHNPALKKLNRDVKRLERLEHRQGYNVL
jgi:hypothetical protein